MRSTRDTRSIFLAILLLSALALTSQAAIITQTYSGPLPVTITGTLPDQGTALEESVTLATAASLTVFTTSYASGGFEPNLMLFDSAGNYITTGITPGSSPLAAVDHTTGLALDGYLTAFNLPAGMYTVTLTDFLLNQALTATNLSGGFTANYGSGTTFVDEQQNLRSSNYALTIRTSVIPEPSTLLLAGPILIWLAIRARKPLLGGGDR